MATPGRVLSTLTPRGRFLVAAGVLLLLVGAVLGPEAALALRVHYGEERVEVGEL